MARAKKSGKKIGFCAARSAPLTFTFGYQRTPPAAMFTSPGTFTAPHHLTRRASSQNGGDGGHKDKGKPLFSSAAGRGRVDKRLCFPLFVRCAPHFSAAACFVHAAYRQRRHAAFGGS